MRNATKVYLNTWGAYNEGHLGYGWMTPEEAINFMDADPERDGGEFFVADIDNYLDIKFSDYDGAEDVCNQIIALEELDDDELEIVKALMEYKNCDAETAISDKDNYSTWLSKEDYFDMLDEDIEYSIKNETLKSYFDYEAYHRDCLYDVYEADNGVIILD